MKITNIDKVTLALILEGGQAKINDLMFHLTITKKQIRKALNTLIKQGMVVYEVSTQNYILKY
jgi:predicted transcriptional regulator